MSEGIGIEQLTNCMKLNLNFQFKNLDGTEHEAHCGQQLASHLANASQGDSLKLYGWAKKLYAKEDVELDDSDKEVLKEFVKSHQHIPNWIKAQTLEVINK